MQTNSIVIPKNERIVSIDILRGIVMIIMALDHTRDFFHSSALLYDPLNLDKTSVPIFFTRWITHFCAPIFVFLAGTSAYLTLARKGKKGLSKFLFTRGLWLVIAELTFVNFGYDFMAVFSFNVLQTIWALGISMMFLSLFIYLPKRLLLFIALAIVFGHNALDNLPVPENGFVGFVWSLLHRQRFLDLDGYRLLVAYPVLPWIGVMSAGYCFGEIFTTTTGDRRRKVLIAIGTCCLVLFLLLRLFNVYGDFSKWSVQKNGVFTLLSFVNTTKYPPSLLYSLMTIGPAILFLAFAEKPLNRITNTISIYGRVPMFYYVLHIYFIHLAYVLVGLTMGFPATTLLGSNMLEPLPEPRFPLLIVYLAWICIVALLYPFCQRYDAYKLANKQKWWLSYL